VERRGERLVGAIAIYTAVLAAGLTRLIVVLAAVLVGVPGVLSLIGGIGLLMVPASIMFFVAAFTASTARTVPGSPT